MLSHALPVIGVDALVRQWLAQDAPGLETGAFVVGDAPRRARLLAKSPGVLAGVPFAQAVFDCVGSLRVEWFREDGQEISQDEARGKLVVAVVHGPARKILLAERTALNVLSRASGVATLARRLVNLSKPWHGLVAATRKTTPGFGLVEKYAVLVGGAATHRMDLSQMTMLKDNHVWSVGSIAAAVRAAQRVAGFSQKIEVEVQSYEEAVEACNAGADIVMLDNMKPDRLKAEAKRLKQLFPKVIIEASGGIREDSIVEYLSPDVDVVSVGQLTQGYACLDFSLKVEKLVVGGGGGAASKL